MKTRISGIALASFIWLAAGGAHAAILSLEPSPSSIGVGETSVVDLSISDLGNFMPTSLGAFIVEVSFDEAVLSFETASYGTLLGGPLDSDQVPPSATGNIVTLDEFSFLSNAELDALQPASFVLASLTFRGVAVGVSDLGFGFFDLADTSFPSMPIDPELASSSITVMSSDIPIPAPVTLPLLAMAVAGLGFIDWRRRKVV